MPLKLFITQKQNCSLLISKNSEQRERERVTIVGPVSAVKSLKLA